ncbi:MAG: glutathione peroxidase [Actinomycetota bacterium]
MRRPAALLATVLLVLALAACGGSSEREAKVGGAPAAPPEPPAGATSVLTGAAPLIDGTEQALDAYRGQVVLVVNTASRCGFTSQYEGLQDIYADYRDQGFTVLAFPSNDFKQELDSDAEVKEFCSLDFGVEFPLFARSAVTGQDANPLFAALAAAPEGVGAPPEWNFTKYLLDRDGRPVGRFSPSVRPTEPRLTNQIEALLAA